MANLKNITELPVAESAEGLNLIVNDNGAAKQIAASAVGAQADFAVTDEKSPAFIKNKPVADYIMKPTKEECTLADNTLTITTNFDEMAKVIEAGGHVTIVIPAGLRTDIQLACATFPVAWLYMEGQGLMAASVVMGELIIVFPNGTYIPSFLQE